LRVFGGVLVGCVLLAGCGSDGEAGKGISDLDMNKRLSQISNEELQKLCSDVDSWASQDQMDVKLKEFGCRIRGSIAASLATDQSQRKQACSLAYDPCAAAAPPTASNGGATCTAPPSTCSSTVGELQTCLQEMTGAIDGLLAVLPTCDMVATTMGSPVAAALTKIPSSCQTLNSQCAGWDKLPGSSPTTPK
jgi:outer membrane murein-binding lipoprotein Lpp